MKEIGLGRRPLRAPLDPTMTYDNYVVRYILVDISKLFSQEFSFTH